MAYLILDNEGTRFQENDNGYYEFNPQSSDDVSSIGEILAARRKTGNHKPVTLLCSSSEQVESSIIRIIRRIGQVFGTHSNDRFNGKRPNQPVRVTYPAGKHHKSFFYIRTMQNT